MVDYNGSLCVIWNHGLTPVKRADDEDEMNVLILYIVGP